MLETNGYSPLFNKPHINGRRIYGGFPSRTFLFLTLFFKIQERQKSAYNISFFRSVEGGFRGTSKRVYHPLKFWGVVSNILATTSRLNTLHGLLRQYLLRVQYTNLLDAQRGGVVPKSVRCAICNKSAWSGWGRPTSVGRLIIPCRVVLRFLNKYLFVMGMSPPHKPISAHDLLICIWPRHLALLMSLA